MLKCVGRPKSTSTLLIRGARQLITLRGAKGTRRGPDLSELHIITDGALLVRDGVIREVGPTRRVENLSEARNAVEINAAGRVVMPGFVDCHTHLVFPGPGTPQSGLETALRHLHGCSGNLLRSRVQRSLESMVRHGTTTAGAKTGATPDIPAETKLIRVLAALRRTPVDLVSTFLCSDTCPEFVSRCGELLARAHRRGIGVAEWVWSGPGANAALCDEFLRSARSLGMACKIHAHSADPGGAIAAALANEAISIDHLEHATAGDAALLAGSNVIATLLPAASFRMGGPYVPARALIDAGAAVALATDFSPQEASTLSMQTVISLACAQLGMTPAEAVTAATFNAAHALSRADSVGSLEPGKRADLVLLNTADYTELAHHLGTNLVHMTVKNGAVIYCEGKVIAKSEKDLSAA
jgi:imidazolonepropionase